MELTEKQHVVIKGLGIYKDGICVRTGSCFSDVQIIDLSLLILHASENEIDIAFEFHAGYRSHINTNI